MLPCANHPDRGAVYKCIRCGKCYCESCAEGYRGQAVCYECLKKIGKTAKDVKYGRLTASIVFGALLAIAIGMLVLFQFVGSLNLPYLDEDTFVDVIKDFVATPGAQAAAAVIAVSFLYFVLAAALIANKKWAYYAGLVLNAAVIYATLFYGPFRVSRFFELQLACLVALSIIIASNRKLLRA
jgi:hypothetical protein